MRPCNENSVRKALRVVVICALAALASAAASPEDAAKGAGPDQACEAIRGLPQAARTEVLALARILALKPAMAIDFSSRTNEMCLNTGGPVMAHFSTRPADTGEDVIYFIDAAPLVARGLRLQEFPAIDPQQGRMEPSTWYRYEGKGTEPHHGMEMRERTWLILAVDVR